jgi:hypothetical protein
MRATAVAVLLSASFLAGAAQAASGDCPQNGAPGAHTAAIEQDPTVPAHIGGCGTGGYKLHQYKKHLKELEDQQQMIGPKATGSGESL